MPPFSSKQIGMTDTIIEYINSELDIDIRDKRKTNRYVFGRAIFYRLASEYTTLAKFHIGKCVGKDHATVIHSEKAQFDQAMMDPKFRRLYEVFKEIPKEGKLLSFSSLIELNKELTSKIIELKKENETLSEIKPEEKQDLTRIESLLDGLEDSELDNVYERLEAIVKVTKALKTSKNE